MEQLGRILIVDDNQDVLFALNLLLEPYAEKIKVAVARAMRLSEGNVTRAAEQLGITRFALYRKLEKLGL